MSFYQDERQDRSPVQVSEYFENDILQQLEQVRMVPLCAARHFEGASDWMKATVWCEFQSKGFGELMVFSRKVIKIVEISGAHRHKVSASRLGRPMFRRTNDPQLRKRTTRDLQPENRL